MAATTSLAIAAVTGAITGTGAEFHFKILVSLIFANTRLYCYAYKTLYKLV